MVDNINPSDNVIEERGYKFSYNWIVRHIPTLTTLITTYKPKRILEIGSHEGRSSCFFIEECSAIAKKPMHITCIDTWQWPPPPDKGQPGSRMEIEVQNRFDENTKLALSRSEYGASMRKIRMPSSRALAQLISNGEKFDFCYIDGSHMAHDVLSDAVMAFHVMSVNSTIVFDDYLWNDDDPRNKNPLTSPKIAIDAFANIFGKKVYQMAKFPTDQGYFRKFAD